MSARKIILVDIDGTISKVGDRLKYLQQDKPDWDNFYEDCFEDEPIRDIIELIEILFKSYHCYKIVFCTGRRESVRKKTLTWINKHLCLFGDFELLMRPDKDFRHDTEVKPEQIQKAGIKYEDIAFVLEDRDSMVKKWREMGLRCLQVAEGNF